MGEHTQEPPPPVPGEQIDVWIEVMRDMQDRRMHGIAHYGTPLQPFNGRKALIDAYLEVLDLAVYLKQKLIEERLETDPVHKIDAQHREEDRYLDWCDHIVGVMDQEAADAD